jgi:hypothetical protein
MTIPLPVLSSIRATPCLLFAPAYCRPCVPLSAVGPRNQPSRLPQRAFLCRGNTGSFLFVPGDQPRALPILRALVGDSASPAPVMPGPGGPTSSHVARMLKHIMTGAMLLTLALIFLSPGISVTALPLDDPPVCSAANCTAGTYWANATQSCLECPAGFLCVLPRLCAAYTHHSPLVSAVAWGAIQHRSLARQAMRSIRPVLQVQKAASYAQQEIISCCRALSHASLALLVTSASNQSQSPLPARLVTRLNSEQGHVKHARRAAFHLHLQQRVLRVLAGCTRMQVVRMPASSVPPDTSAATRVQRPWLAERGRSVWAVL